MNIIEIKQVSKCFKILKRQEGLWGSFKNLFSRDYLTIQAIEDISLDIKKGEILGFLGPNGAGKSTAIKMMIGVLEPTKGEIFVNGIIPHKNRIKHLRNIGVVFGQRSQLWWNLPVIESFKILKAMYKIDNKTYKSNLNFFEELVNLHSLYNLPVRILSLGQKMLCELTAAFLHNPNIIFLDEPTIGLDVAIKSKIRTLITKMNQEQKTTVILTTHDIGDIDALCHRIVIVDHGKLIFNDKIDKIKKIFGTFRVLKISAHEINDNEMQNLENKIRGNFKENDNNVKIVRNKSDWIDITFNENKVNVVDLLNYITTSIKLVDIKIEDISTEEIIKKIYLGKKIG